MPNNTTHINTLLNIKKRVAGKRVLYIATTYLDYIRVQQEISTLNRYSKRVYLIVSKKKNYFIRMIYVYFRCLFFFKKVDVIFIGFAPQLILPFFKWRFLNKVIIIDFFISLYDTLINDRKKFSQTSFFSNGLMFFDKLTLKWADFVLSDTKAHATYFIDQLGCDKNKISTLYLQADKKYYYPKFIKKPAHLKDKFVVLYFGSVLPLQGTKVIMDTIKLCENDNIFFIMIGPFNSSHCKNKNVEFINWLEQEELSRYIAFSDLCLAGHFNADIDKASRTIPGKAYIYEAMNKPMILGDNKANRERYPKIYNLVRFVKMGSATDLLKTITEIYKGEIHEKS